jgi:hypothetical protein
MTAADPTYCPRCGEDLGGGDAHADCDRALLLEPPRYCPHCRRRMVVQVTPGGWSARCVEHGTTVASTSDSSFDSCGAS